MANKYAKRGFPPGDGEVLMVVFGFIRIVKVEYDALLVSIDQVIFVEDGLRDNVFFRGPIAEILFAATIAAKREVAIFF